ncbi:MAG: DUF4412 domain-containing protein [Bacteroidota bacterium]
MRKLLIITLLNCYFACYCYSQNTTKIDFYQFDNNNDTIGKVKTLYFNKTHYRMDVITGNFNSSVIENFNSDTMIFLVNHEKTYSYILKKNENNKYPNHIIKKKCSKNNPVEILGYTCYPCRIKEIWKDYNRIQLYTVWYTPTVNSCFLKKELDYNKIPGIVLQISYPENENIVKAVSISLIEDYLINYIPKEYILF